MTTCIITIIKNEHEYLNEFIKYHLDLGVDHIFIFEDEGSDTHIDIVKKYGDKVTLKSVFELPDDELKRFGYMHRKDSTFRGDKQLCYYKEGLWWIKENFDYDWCFVIDCDEFITLERNNSSLETELNKYSEYDVVALQWQNYGASGHIKKPDYGVKGLIETYTQKCGRSINDRNYHTMKNVYNLNTFKKSSFRGVHVCDRAIKWCKTDYSKDLKTCSYQNIYIRHYITKSWEEYVYKLNVRGMFHPKHRNYEEFFCMNEDLRDRQEEMMDMIPEIISIKQ